MLKSNIIVASVSVFALTLAGCASTRPPAPSLTVIPGVNKSPVAFERDADTCDAAAQRAVGGQSPGAAANDAAISSAVVGTALGALAGTAIGAASGRAGAGAAIGAGTGLLAGSAIGANQGAFEGGAVQARFDNVYAQCMQARGHQIINPPAPRETVIVYERPEPVYVYPRPYVRPYYHRDGYYRRW
jgi:outer membrane lipoprotein SlyB